MKKQIIRLTESDLHNIITESVNRILNESSSHSEEYIMVDVYDVGSRFVYGRGEIESGAQIILQRGIDVADVADLSAQRRKVV